MASFTRGTVLECAIEPCTNPAEIEVSIVGYGEYPPMVVRLCPPCANAFGKLLHDWPLPPAGEMDIRAGSLASKRDEEAPAYLKELQAPTGEQYKRLMYGTFLPEEEEDTPSFVREPRPGDTFGRRVNPFLSERDTEDTPERYPTRSPYVTTGRAPIGKVIWNENGIPWIEGEEYTPSLVERKREELHRMIEKGLRDEGYLPPSDEDEQHKAGWLPGDD